MEPRYIASRLSAAFWKFALHLYHVKACSSRLVTRTALLDWPVDRCSSVVCKQPSVQIAAASPADVASNFPCVGLQASSV